MWLIGLRDLQWRRRRFVIAVVATGLVFGISLLMAGTTHTMYEEGRRIVRSFDADAWLVATDATGPFTATTPVPASSAVQTAAVPGVEAADPVVILHSTLKQDPPRDVNVIGFPPDSFAAGPVSEGRAVAAAGETVADVALGLEPGDTVRIGGRDLRVVGLADQVTWYFGTPTLFVSLDDAQAIAFGGQPLATAVVTRGVPQAAVPDLRTVTEAQVIADLERPLKSSTDTVAFLNTLLWIVAAGIIGSMVYLSALERSRDFAVLKATGATNRTLLGGLVLQAMILSIVSAVVAAVIAALLAPLMAFSVEFPIRAYAQLGIVVVVVGLVASIAGLRRAVTVQPALAFGGA